MMRYVLGQNPFGLRPLRANPEVGVQIARRRRLRRPVTPRWIR
jgi:hypothetical protein